jgi:uncharacterized membrane protein YbhN (UPF0104 family)
MRVLRVVWRVLLLGALAGLAGLVLWWRGPNWPGVLHAFAGVGWRWVVVAVGFNLLSVLVRALCWQKVIDQSMRRPHPRYPLVLSGYSVGMLANAVLPGRVGEAARVSVLVRRLPSRKGLWPTLLGTVAAQRLLDLFPLLALVLCVLVFATVPGWAFASLLVIVSAGSVLLAWGILLARKHERLRLERLGRLRGVILLLRQGLGVLRRPRAAVIAGLFEATGWLCQLLAVWATMRAFHLHLPLIGYGIPYTHGFAFGIGLQAIEASVGITFGTAFFLHEGLSLTHLRSTPDEAHIQT